jgi:hypothetical protein
MSQPTLDHILANTISVGDCRRWIGVTRPKSGMPQMSVDGRKVMVTRIVWLLTHPRGHLSSDHAVVHSHDCEWRDCVEPSHLLKVRARDAWRYRKVETS